MNFYAFFALVLCGLVGCGPGNSGAIRHLFGTAAPVQFKVGYVAGDGVPPLMFGGSIGYGWKNDEKVAIKDFVCNNAQALLPGKDCFYPNTLDDMTSIAAVPTADGYDDTAIFAATDLIPDDDSTLKVVFLDGVYTPRTSTTCSDASCHFGYTVKKPGHAEVSAVFLPEIRQFVDSRFGGSTSGVGQDMFAYLVAATIIHEALGHQLGLVDGETPAVANHEDPNSAPHHCTNPKCIMHATGPGITWWDWSRNRKTLGAAAGDLLFDSDCQTDIRRAITY